FGVILTEIGWTPPYQAATKGADAAQAKGAPKQPPAGKDPRAADSSLLHTIEQQAEGAVKDSKDYLVNTGSNLKGYTDALLKELKEATARVTNHLPQPVQNFLDQGGWWWVLGVCAVLALLWLRSMVRKLRGAVPRSKRMKQKKWRAKAIPIKLQEDLQLVGEG